MITKEVIGHPKDLETLAAWLTAKLVPDYCDSVTMEAKSDTITTDRIAFRTADHLIAYYDCPASNSASFHMITNDTNQYASSYTQFQATAYVTGYVCKTAVVLTFRTNNVAKESGAIAFTKDNTGQTVLIAPTNLAFAGQATLLSVLNAYRVTRYDESVMTPPLDQRFTANKMCATVMTPFLIETSDGSVVFTPDAYFCTSYQYADAGALVFDGKDYLSLGAWAFLDE